MARIYLASSWRNAHQPHVRDVLRENGHLVYDFRDPLGGGQGFKTGRNQLVPSATAFAWSEIDPSWQQWRVRAYREILQTHMRAAQGYVGDLRGMEWADTCVLLMPCGRSAHLEAGYMKGRGKRLVIHFADEEGFEPDLMYLLADHMTYGDAELTDVLRSGS